MLDLQETFNNRDWFHSIGEDERGRIVVYVNYISDENLYDIPDEFNGKQVLVHFAASKLSSKEKFSDNNQEESDDVLTSTVSSLIKDLGKERVESIFYEVHDGDDAVTQFSDKYPHARDCMERLYDEYGFDVIYDMLK